MSPRHARAAMPDAPYEKMLLVCTFGPWCRLDGGSETHARLKQRAKDAGLDHELRVVKSGCLNQCGHGPIVASVPDNTWYAHVTPGEADALFEEHVLAGRPLERLRYHAEKPGSNKTQEVRDKERVEKAAKAAAAAGAQAAAEEAAKSGDQKQA